MKLLLGKLLIGVCVIASGGYGVYALRAPVEDGEIHETYTVRNGPLRITLKEKGQLKAKEYIKVQTKLRNGGTITFLMDEGKQVSTGDVLVEFDTKELQNTLDQQSAQLNTDKLNLEIAETNLALEIAEGDKSIAAAKYKLEIAETQLDKYLNGDRIKAERDLDLKVRQAESKLKRAKEKFETMPDLLKEGFVTASQVEEERLNHETALTEHKSALQELELWRKYSDPMDLKQKQIDVENARTDLDSTQKQVETKVKQRRSTVEQQKARVRRQEEMVANATEEMENAVIKAETEGIVLYGDPERPWEMENIKLGAKVWNRQTIMTIPDTSAMVVSFSVHEVDINKLKTGQDTIITCESYPGKSFNGKILKVASVAESDNWWSRGEAKKFKIECSLDSNGVELKPGITAKVEVLIDELADVLFVPLQSVYAEKGKQYCLRRNGAGFERVEVEIGRANDSFVEITAGLKENDEVALYEVGNVDGEENDGKEGDAVEP